MKNGDLPAAFTMRLPGSVKQWKSLIKWESVDISTSPPSVTQFQCMGVWDTGATSTVISRKVATDNGLLNKLIGYQTIHTANGSINSPVCLLKATLVSNTSYVTIPNLSVSIADMGVDALIGMDIISLGEMYLGQDRKTNESILTFRYPPTHSSDYQQENNLVDTALQKIKNKRNGNIPCPCRSGKKIKDCHWH